MANKICLVTSPTSRSELALKSRSRIPVQKQLKHTLSTGICGEEPKPVSGMAYEEELLLVTFNVIIILN